MAEDINPQLRSDLNAALAVLAPQLRGLHDMAAFETGDALGNSINQQISARQHRHDLIQNVIGALDNAVNQLAALEADGYPALPSTPLDPSQFNELQQQSADLTAAIAVFVETEATHLSVNLGDPADKPTGG